MKREQRVPFFYYKPFEVIQYKIEELLQKRFQEEDLKDCFLVDIKESKGSRKIEVYVESDNRISFSQCGIISRYLESFLDEEDSIPDNYILEVSSPGIDRPLKQWRQYRLNLGKKLDITLSGNRKVTGILKEAKAEAIVLEKKSGEKENIPIDKIESAKIKISF